MLVFDLFFCNTKATFMTSSHPLSRMLSVRVSDKTYKQLQQLSEHSNKKVSRLLRFIIDEHIQQRSDNNGE